MKAIQTKYLGPTNTKSGRIKAWAEGVPALTKSYDHALNSDGNHAAVAVALAHKYGWIESGQRLRSGRLPNGDMCHVLPARRSVPIDKAKLHRLIAAANRVAELMDHCPDDETAAEAGLELERAAAAIGE